MKHYPVPHVTMTIHHGNIGLYAPHDGRFRSENPALPWAVLATLNVKFHFDKERERFKVLKVKVPLGMKEPKGHQLTDAYGMARSKLIHELNAHGVFSVFEDDLDLYDCGVTRWPKKPEPLQPWEPF